MAVREKGDVFESYERALSGPKMDEQEWDRKLIARLTLLMMMCWTACSRQGLRC